jgi:hypothetical protein
MMIILICFYFIFKILCHLIPCNGLFNWSAGLKVGNFQNRTEPIRLFIFPFFMPIVKDGLAVIEQGENAGKPSPLALHLHIVMRSAFIFQVN